MKPDEWLKVNLGEEYFSGNFAHLKTIIENHQLQPRVGKIVTFAGTNGKGQTARYLDTLLLNSNRSTALWTSPHLLKVNERFSYNGDSIDDFKLINSFEQTKKLFSTEFSSLSYFEFLFLNFLHILKTKPVEFIILEVGLGGRLDAANCLDCDLACVTSIARDHQHLLGNRYDSILSEKLGIFRANSYLLTCLETSYLRKKTKIILGKNTEHWRDLCEEGLVTKDDHFSKRNLVLATEAFTYLTHERATQELNQVSSAMRYSGEISHSFYDLFPSHNLDGLRKLVQFLKQEQYNIYDLVMISFSNRSEKDLLAMSSLIKSELGELPIKLVSFEHIKSINKGMLVTLKNEFEFEMYDDIYSAVKSVPTNSKVLVFGSNYFLGAFLQSNLR